MIFVLAMHVLFEDITEIELVTEKMMGVNFNGAVWCAHAAIPYMKPSSKEGEEEGSSSSSSRHHGGHFCAVSSVAGEISPPFLTLYSAAKHAINGNCIII